MTPPFPDRTGAVEEIDEIDLELVRSLLDEAPVGDALEPVTLGHASQVNHLRSYMNLLLGPCQSQP